MFNAVSILGDFPILQKKIHNDKRLVYLDNAATSQKPELVIEAMSNYYRQHNANVHRGVHQLGDESTKLFHQSRRRIANFFGAETEEFVVVRNTTEAINQVAYTWGEKQIIAGDMILCTEMEHHSNLVPWQKLAKRKNAQLVFLKVNKFGELELDRLEELLKSGKVKIICLTHVSNALGTVNPIEKIIETTRQLSPKTKVLIDGAQAAPHMPIHFDDLGADFYTLSAHKMLGPMGIGGLFIKLKVLEELEPFLYGGGMINTVSLLETEYADDIEERFSPGTPDVAGLVGWAAACEYLHNIGMEILLKHDQLLVKYAIEQLQKIPQVKLVGITDLQKLSQRVGSVAFVYQGVHAHDVGQILDSEGVAVRSGHHCTMPLHNKFGWPATVRVSFQLYNSTDDIDILVRALQKVEHVFGK